MELQNAISLIQNDSLVLNRVTTWADLGCGKGLFTHALSSLLPPGSIVYAVDSNPELLFKMEDPSNGIVLQKVQADFSRDPLPFDGLDGILMANSLHFVRDKERFLLRAEKWLRQGGCFLFVEYDTDQSNPWVPYPISFYELRRLFEKVGYKKVDQIGERPSIYHRAPIYSALVKRTELSRVSLR